MHEIITPDSPPPGTGRSLVLGDVHGAHRALVQVLERSCFDRQCDRLIFLGDVADGWPDTRACIDELLGIPNFVGMIGNHDAWFLEWLDGESARFEWTSQGGMATLDSYGARAARYGASRPIPSEHHAFLKALKPWHEEDGRMFVHGGWPWRQHPHPEACPTWTLTWDRSLWENAHQRAVNGRKRPLTQFSEVYVGHSCTMSLGYTEPVQRCEVWNLDQGAGWDGRLSIMDVESKQFWQSDVVAELYPDAPRR